MDGPGDMHGLGDVCGPGACVVQGALWEGTTPLPPWTDKYV